MYGTFGTEGKQLLYPLCGYGALSPWPGSSEELRNGSKEKTPQEEGRKTQKPFHTLLGLQR